MFGCGTVSMTYNNEPSAMSTQDVLAASTDQAQSVSQTEFTAKTVQMNGTRTVDSE